MASLKEALSAKTFIHPQDQRLVYGGKELRDEVNWDAYGLQEESTLDSLLRCASLFKMPTRLRLDRDGSHL